jgi:NAD(P)-dependent dehydrogenase (short-subunit alcohol dehydrogenase family)
VTQLSHQHVTKQNPSHPTQPQLRNSGRRTSVLGTNAERNEAAVRELSEHGTVVRALRCDGAEESDVDEAFAEAVRIFGRVDSCFANAGVAGGGTSFVDTSLAEFRRVTRVNLDGAFLTLRAAARHMVDRGGGGVLVGTSSVSAIHGTPRNQAYSASKAGLAALIRGLAVELARHGISAHAIVAGWTESRMASPLLHDEKFENAVRKRMPVRRWGEPGDYAALAVYLASRPGNGFHTGDSFVVDGGYSIF